MSRTWLTSFVLLAVGCSFFTPFPEVDKQGGGGSTDGGAPPAGGNGGDGAEGGGVTGGGGSNVVCVSELCQNCLAGNCAEPDEVLTLLGPSSALGTPNASTSVDVTDAASTGEGPIFVGTYRRDGALLNQGGQAVANSVAEQTGIIIENGAVTATAIPCDGSGNPLTEQEAFLFGVADAGAYFAVAGAFEGQWLNFGGACGQTVNRAGAPTGNGGAFAPFLAFFRDDGSGIEQVLDAMNPGQSNENGYFSDVATLVPNDGSVVAIGVASQNPFVADPGFDGVPRHYLLTSSGANVLSMAVTDRRVCNTSNFVGGGVLEGLQSGVAVDEDGDVWIAGTGCDFKAPSDSPPRGFVRRIAMDGTEIVGPPQGRDFGSDESPVRIWDIATAGDWVYVAGTYEGAAFQEYGFPDADGAADGFVMAFKRSTFDAVMSPSWFVRILSDQPAKIGGLAAAGARVYVTGSTTDSGGIGDAIGCFGDVMPTGGRAFVASLSDEFGTLEWFRFDGFEPMLEYDPNGAFAFGSALVVDGNHLVTATRTHGHLVTTCGFDSSNTNTDTQPEAIFRRFPDVLP